MTRALVLLAALAACAWLFLEGREPTPEAPEVAQAPPPPPPLPEETATGGTLEEPALTGTPDAAAAGPPPEAHTQDAGTGGVDVLVRVAGQRPRDRYTVRTQGVSVTTDERGRARLRLPTGGHVVSLHSTVPSPTHLLGAARFRALLRETVQVGEALVPLSFELGAVVVEVRDAATGAPVEGAQVHCLGSRKPSGPDGRARFEGPPRRSSVYVETDSHKRQKAQDFEVSPGRPTRVLVELEPCAHLDLTWRQADGGAPLLPATFRPKVVAAESEEVPSPKAQVRKDGISYRELPLGTYRVEIEDERGAFDDGSPWVRFLPVDLPEPREVDLGERGTHAVALEIRKRPQVWLAAWQDEAAAGRDVRLTLYTDGVAGRVRVIGVDPREVSSAFEGHLPPGRYVAVLEGSGDHRAEIPVEVAGEDIDAQLEVPWDAE